MDGLKEIITAVQDRIKSPILGSIALMVVVLNWQAFFVVIFTRKLVEDKFQYFDCNTTAFTLIAQPIVLGVALAFFTPWIAYVGARLAEYPRYLKKKLEISAKYELKDEEEDRKADHAQAILKNKAKQAKKIAEIEDDDLKEQAKEAIKVGANPEKSVLGAEKHPMGYAAALHNILFARVTDHFNAEQVLEKIRSTEIQRDEIHSKITSNPKTETEKNINFQLNELLNEINHDIHSLKEEYNKKS